MILKQPARRRLADSIKHNTELYDTTITESIKRGDRRKWLDVVLELFASKDAVVTDRFHGLIFSVLTRRPTVVLRTVDHKLESALEELRRAFDTKLTLYLEAQEARERHAANRLAASETKGIRGFVKKIWSKVWPFGR